MPKNQPSQTDESVSASGNVASAPPAGGAESGNVATGPAAEVAETKAIVDGYWDWCGRLVEAATEEEALSMLDALLGKERVPYGVQPASRHPELWEQVVHWRPGQIGLKPEDSQGEKQVVYALR